MKTKVRSNTFETNSSSVHSIVIDNSGREPSKLKIDPKDNKIVVDFGQFGKEDRIYSEQYDKLSYLVTSLYYLSGFDYDDIYENYEFKRIEEIVCRYTGASGIKILGYQEPEIDHQSQPEYDITIIDSYDEDSVINFIFNKYVSLQTGCD